MRGSIFLLLSGIASIASSAPVVGPPGVVVRGCSSGRPGDGIERPRRGEPLQLREISCVPFRSSNFGTSEEIVAPDGKSVARWHRGSPAPVEAATTAGTALFSLPDRVAFRSFGSITDAFGAAPEALAWASDSKSLWGVRQQTASPSGFAQSGLSPIRIGVDGRVRTLPPLKHAAGPLDAIMWIGGDGLALAQFGTRGGRYRPEHDDPSPTIAIVDAARGWVRASLTVSSIRELQPWLRTGYFQLAGADAVVLPDGRIRALLRFPGWADPPAKAPAGVRRERPLHPGRSMLWTEGSAPREIAVDDKDNSRAISLTPDGAHLLIVHRLQPIGVQILDCMHCPPPPPPKPVTGTRVELIDIASGRQLWRITATVAEFWNEYGASAVSRDGRYGLVEMTPLAGKRMVALVEMKTGRVFQQFSATRVGSYKQAFGFTADGRGAWLTCNNEVFRYSSARR